MLPSMAVSAILLVILHASAAASSVRHLSQSSLHQLPLTDEYIAILRRDAAWDASAWSSSSSAAPYVLSAAALSSPALPVYVVPSPALPPSTPQLDLLRSPAFGLLRLPRDPAHASRFISLTRTSTSTLPVITTSTEAVRVSDAASAPTLLLLARQHPTLTPSSHAGSSHVMRACVYFDCEAGFKSVSHLASVYACGRDSGLCVAVMPCPQVKSVQVESDGEQVESQALCDAIPVGVGTAMLVFTGTTWRQLDVNAALNLTAATGVPNTLTPWHVEVALVEALNRRDDEEEEGTTPTLTGVEERAGGGCDLLRVQVRALQHTVDDLQARVRALESALQRQDK